MPIRENLWLDLFLGELRLDLQPQAVCHAVRKIGQSHFRHQVYDLGIGEVLLQGVGFGAGV